ncbi:type II toxin-antitoxin system VapC family toxin [Sandaracinobacter neustonicus]|uniref:Ribonuclease VapC n=1 Tax=Sandaracinobacter neustonicus TaxID=1715348 RepID=A0A501XGN9_9SPHN|nr:PIN domain-containing protein [Sandaracinobacter neustonicus]TPE59454.1 type II toxin-antitoxin system VapC family toxin [Sandaracinobacter neustonicus]
MGSPALSLRLAGPALFDSNILIDFLSRRQEAEELILHAPGRLISVITTIEILAGTPEAAWPRARQVLSAFEELPLDDAVRDEAARIRRATRLKLPDAIILATARIHRLPLVTRNIRDFPEGSDGVILPYTLT